MDYAKESLRLHRQWKGKLTSAVKMKIATRDLSLAYTPGVAQPCLEIQKDIDQSYELTGRGNCVAVITDGTAVLGLGDIGPEAGMPVMEGKCVLFKEFGGSDEIVNIIAALAGSFGGINLEDIAAPRCFEIEAKLKERCDIPVFHDDQHGTAIVVAAALINAVKVCGKEMGQLKIVINGAGSAGIAIAQLLARMEFGDIVLCDRFGILDGDDSRLNEAQRAMAKATNRHQQRGTLRDAIRQADVFIGVSAPNAVDGEMISSMADHAIVFPMANPTPEIMPDEAKQKKPVLIL